MTRGRTRALAIAGGVVGAVLFVWALRVVGVAAIVGAFERLGAGFVAVVALGGVRHLVRAAAWRLCFDDPRSLPLRWGVAAYVAGDAVGNVTPFGILASEPSKIVLMRHRLAPAEAIPALALENLFYGATVVAMLVGGTAALLVAFDVTPAIRNAGLLVVGAAVATIAAILLIARLRPRLARPLLSFVSRHRARLLPIALLELAYHASAVFEIWFALTLIAGAAPTVLTAFVLECVNRTITIAFQFVPMWLGVDEAGTGLMTTALGLSGATGVALALVRKARIAIWTAAGLSIVAIFRSSSPRHDDDRRAPEGRRYTKSFVSSR